MKYDLRALTDFHKMALIDSLRGTSDFLNFPKSHFEYSTNDVFKKIEQYLNSSAALDVSSLSWILRLYRNPPGFSLEKSLEIIEEIFRKMYLKYDNQSIEFFYTTCVDFQGFTARHISLLEKMRIFISDTDLENLDVVGALSDLLRRRFILLRSFEFLDASKDRISFRLVIFLNPVILSEFLKRDISPVNSPIGLNRENELFYNESTGEIIFKNKITFLKRGTKLKAFVDFLYRARTYRWKIEDIQEFCNARISNKRHYIVGKKDVYDLLRNLKQKLRVSAGDVFPIKHEIGERGDVWFWI